MGLYIGLGLLLVALYGGHHWLLERRIAAPPQQYRDVEVYPVGEGWIIRRPAQDPLASVVVAHGFLESPLYFADHYQDPRIELIMISNSGYQLPLLSDNYPPAAWARDLEYPSGTIAADAELINLALDHLTSSRNVRVHGHSRGAAVVLQAANHRPDLFNSVEVLLEAAVLPQGRPYRQLPGVTRWFLPLVHLLWQGKPSAALSSPAWGSLENAHKRELIMAMPFNPKDSRVMLTNLRDLLDWMRGTGTDIYRHVQRGAVLVPGDDRILNSEAMLSSARQAENLQIIEVPGGSHFVLLDNPEAIPPLLRNP